MTINKLNVYDGVPIGPDNFTDYFSSVNKTINSVIEHTLRDIQGEKTKGGYIETNPIVFKQFGEAFGTSSAFKFPSGTDSENPGVLFGKLDSDFYRFEFPYVNSIEDLRVNTWEILVTSDTSVSDLKLTYGNQYTANGKLQLPIRPVVAFKNRLQQEEARYGFYEVRYNGVTQTNYQYTANPSGLAVGLTLPYLNLGAENPNPVTKEGKYLQILNPSSNGATLDEYKAALNDGSESFRISFPHTNFSLETGGNILIGSSLGPFSLPQSKKKYTYIPLDLSGGDTPAVGTYKIIDAVKGEISINVSTEQLRFINQIDDSPSDVKFKIFSAEQLVEEVSENSVKYKTRYGTLYDGKSLNTELVSVSFSEGEYVTSNTFRSNVSYTGDVSKSELYESTSGVFNDSILLALTYGCIAKVDTSVQNNKHTPDVLELIYTTGIDKNTFDSTTVSTLLGAIDLNDSSWYNWDVNSFEYYPVPRVSSSYLSLVRYGEIGHSRVIQGFSINSPITKFGWGKAEYKYVHESETQLGTKDILVRADASIPEPHHINAPMIKKHLVNSLHIPEGEQVIYFNDVYLDADIFIDGDFVVL